MKTHLNRTETECVALAESIIVYLNEIMDRNRKAVRDLVETRVPCNEAMAAHPTVQIVGDGEAHEVGLLGIINGLIGVKADGRGYIQARFIDEAEHLFGFELSK